MKTICKEFCPQFEYPLSAIGDPGKLLFFDIETTGLSARSSCLYLIGTVNVENGRFMLRQWFSESLSDEQTVLRSFFEFASGFTTLVSFNGETFDLRYLTDCAAQYGLASPLLQMESFDILKHLRKKRALLPVPNFKQKSIEQFLGLGREDRYTGGELIEVYENYCRNPDPAAERFLLLHNEEDIKGMPSILPALSYEDALRAPFTIEDAGRTKDGQKLEVFAKFPFAFPRPVDYEFSEEIRLHFEDCRIEFRIRLFEGELKYFYPDYKNYYYLTEEGYAIHKKLASFVDKSVRVPASASTAFARMSGVFLPSVPDSGFPLFYPEYRARESWHQLEDRADFLPSYLHALLAAV